MEAYFSLQGDGQALRSFHDYYADGNFNLILRLSTSGCRAVLFGPATVRAVVERDQNAEYLGLRFRLGQTPALVDSTAPELTNAKAELTRIGLLHLDDLAELLFLEREPAARQRLLEGLVLPIPRMVRSARAITLATLIEGENGALGVSDIANRMGISVRSLERLCLAQLGLPPKRLQRVVRLRKALRLMSDNRPMTGTRIAHACGYVDQSHLIKDFKELAGRLPGAPRVFEPRRIQGVPDARFVHRYRDCG